MCSKSMEDIKPTDVRICWQEQGMYDPMFHESLMHYAKTGEAPEEIEDVFELSREWNNGKLCVMVRWA